MNSRDVVGGRVLPGGRGISSSVNRQRMLQRAVRQSDRGGLVTKKEVIQDMDDIRDNQFGLNNPFKYAGKLVKEVRSTPKAEGEYGVGVVNAPPFHA